MKKLRGSKIKSFAQGHTAGHVRAMIQTQAAFSLTSPNGSHVSGGMREMSHTCPEVACAISPTWHKTDVMCCLKAWSSESVWSGLEACHCHLLDV